MHVRACQHNGCGYLSTQADCTTHFTHCTTSPLWFTLYRQVCTTRPAWFTLYEQTTLRRITLSTSTTPALSMEKNGHKTQHRAGTLCPEAQICRNYPSGVPVRKLDHKAAKRESKGLDLKAHEAYFNNDRTDESFVSYTRGASQSLCD